MEGVAYVTSTSLFISSRKIWKAQYITAAVVYGENITYAEKYDIAP